MTVLAATMEQKLAAIEREIRLRKRVYPRWVEQKKMSAVSAVQQIAIMEEIAEDYRALVADERLL